MKTPENILKIIRQRFDLDENDKSEDHVIESMSSLGKLEHVCGWELGDKSWADNFIGWAKGCGMKITDESGNEIH